MRQKGNSHIRKRVLWFIAAMLVLFALVMMAQYSITGQWQQEQDEIIGASLYNEEDIIGTWIVTNGMDDILGVKPTEEIFQADGSWQTGSHDGILRQGLWILNNDVIEVHQTTISVGSTHESTDNVSTYSIINLTADQMECKRGEYTILFQRKK